MDRTVDSMCSLLVSTKIYSCEGGATKVVRDWRVVMIPDDNNSLDILGLFNGICSHTYDPMEPFVGFAEDRPIKAQVGRSQTAQGYHDLPLSVKVLDASKSFGIYFKFFIMGCDDTPVMQQTARKDACKVSSLSFIY